MEMGESQKIKVIRIHPKIILEINTGKQVY